MVVSPFYLLGRSTLERIAQRCEGALGDWAQAWGCARADFVLESVRAWDWRAPRSLQWRSTHRSGEQALWLGCSSDFPAALYGRLFAPEGRVAPAGAALAWDGMQQALKELGLALVGAAAPLAGAPGQPDAAPDAAVFRRGSGAVVLSVRLGEQSMYCVLNHAAAQVAPPAAQALPQPGPPLRTALAEVPLRLSVTLGQVDVDVRSLLAMTVGDVIRLDSLLEQPVLITGPTGQVLFGGHLGTSHGAMAVEVVRKSAN